MSFVPGPFGRCSTSSSRQIPCPVGSSQDKAGLESVMRGQSRSNGVRSKDHRSVPWFEDCPVEDVLRGQRDAWEERAGKSREGEVSRLWG